MSKKTALTFAIIICVVAVGVFVALNQQAPQAPEDNLLTLVGATGGGKENFLADQELAHILQEEYGIRVVHNTVSNSWLTNETKLVEDTTRRYDFMFCSDQRYYEQYLSASNKVYQSRESFIALNTPIVFYSWQPVVEVLMAQGIVTKTGDTYYVSDPLQLLSLVEQQVTWQSLCQDTANPVSKNSNPVSIISVDPVRSSPGVTFYGWIARVLDPQNRTGDITAETLQKLRELYKFSGFLGFAPVDLFDQYLRIGMGSYPLIVDYEKSLIDWAISNPARYATVKDRIVTLYPEPTIWNSHCVISFSEAGDLFVKALQTNQRIQQIAFERYGFRMGLSSAYENTSLFPSEEGPVEISGIPGEIFSTVLPLQTNGYNKILEALKAVH